MKYARILGTGSFLPKKLLTNEDLSKMVDTSDEWITERTGIKRRHVIDKNNINAVTDMAEEAARQALEASCIDKSKIDLVIVATSSPDTIFPNTASCLQHRLGLDANECPVFDVSAACAGFIYALSIAEQYIKSGAAHYVLVVSSEAVTRTADWSDRSTCILFGDGAGAFVLGAAKEPGIYATHLHANGAYNELLYLDCDLYGGTKPSYLRMRGNEVFKVAVTKLGAIVDETLEKNNMKQNQIDWLVPHQANLRIIQATARKLKLPMERVILTIEDQGNTSSASVPIAFDIGVRDGRIKPGDISLLEAFGAGFVWGAALVKF